MQAVKVCVGVGTVEVATAAAVVVVTGVTVE